MSEEAKELLPVGVYQLSPKDFQEVLTYVAKRPLGEVIKVFAALQRANFVPEKPEQAAEVSEPTQA